MNHPVIRWQILSPDPDVSSKFLTQLFGWRVDRDNPMGYRNVLAGDGGIHGGVWPAPPGVNAFVQLYVQVSDIDACITNATALGARVIVPKAVLPEGQEMAVLLDPLGMPIAICTA